MIEARPQTGRVWQSCRGLAAGLVLLAAVWLMPAALAAPAAAPRGAASEPALLASGETLRRLKDEVAVLTQRERSLRARLGAGHAETRAATHELALALLRLDAEVDRLAATAGEFALARPTAHPGSAAMSAHAGRRWLWPVLATGAVSLGALGLLVLALRRRLEPPVRDARAQDAGRTRLDAPLEVDLPAAGDRDSLLAAARMVLSEPDGDVARRVRTLREALDARLPGRGVRVILLTSLAAHTPQALLASNLAHELVRTGERTLLVDADADALLTRILCREPPAAPAAAAVEDAILLDQVTGLWLLPARGGGVPVPAAEIARMRGVFDTIVVSAPSLSDAGGSVPDAVRSADQIVLAAPHGHATPELARIAARRLGTAADSILVVGTPEGTGDGRVGHRGEDADGPAGPRRQAA